MQHEVLAIVAIERIDDLLVLAGAQGGGNQRLGLATGEQGGAVGARQDADLALDLPHVAGAAAIDALAGLKDAAADDTAFQLLEHGRCERQCGLVLAERVHRAAADLVDQLAAAHLVRFPIGGGQVAAEPRFQLVLDLFEPLRRWRHVARFARATLGQFDDRVDYRLHLLVAENHGAQHHLLAELPGLGFDHQHPVAGAGHHQIEL